MQGFCEGVTGLFDGADVVMQQARLKRPVVSTRSSSSTSRPAAPPEPALPRRASSTSLASAAESGSSRARRRPAHEPGVEVLADRSPGLGGSLGNRRGWVADGLRIAAAEGRAGASRGGYVGEVVPQEDVQGALLFLPPPRFAATDAPSIRRNSRQRLLARARRRLRIPLPPQPEHLLPPPRPPLR